MKRRLNLDNYLMNNPIREMIQQKFVAEYMLKASKPMDNSLCLEIGFGIQLASEKLTPNV